MVLTSGGPRGNEKWPKKKTKKDKKIQKVVRNSINGSIIRIRQYK
jgi:hypothetical protein